MDKNRKDEKRKNIIVLSVTILTLIVMLFGVTYAVFLYTYNGEKENSIKTGTVMFSYSETTNGIYINNAVPMSDETGKTISQSSSGYSQGYFDFVVSSTIVGNASIEYEIVGEDISNTATRLDPRYVKVYLTNGENNETPVIGYNQTVPTYSSLDDSDGGKRLYSGTFDNSSSQKFRLRLWLSDDYPMSGKSETFRMKVNVLATA